MLITKNLKKVKQHLLNHPILRDSDFKLIAFVWADEIDDLSKMSATTLLELLGNGKLTNPESIRRVRQKLQAENPDLRGDIYWGRQTEQKKVKDDLEYGK